MTYFKLSELRTRSHLTAGRVDLALRNKSSTGPWDVFLSHAFRDREVIAQVKLFIESQGLSVYVDWVDDPELNRNIVSAGTAVKLRQRMRACSKLIFAVTPTSQESRWMPWELGYFDGIKPGKIAVLPLDATADDRFPGQEYLNLYPKFTNVGGRPMVRVGAQQLTDMRSF